MPVKIMFYTDKVNWICKKLFLHILCLFAIILINVVTGNKNLFSNDRSDFILYTWDESEII